MVNAPLAPTNMHLTPSAVINKFSKGDSLKQRYHTRYEYTRHSFIQSVREQF